MNMAFNPPDLVSGNYQEPKKTPMKFPNIVEGEEFEVNTGGEEAGIPKLLTKEEREAYNANVRQQNAQRKGTNPVSRIYNATVDRFNETEFGLSKEVRDVPDTGIGAIDFTNDVIMNQVADPAFRLLQTLGATGEAGISGVSQFLRETSIRDKNEIDRLERDILALFEVLPTLQGVRLPQAIKGGRIADQATSAAKETKNKILDPFGVDARKASNESALSKEAEDLKIPLSKGDLTSDLKTQQFEEDALKGLEGRAAQEQAAGFRQKQNTAIQERVSTIQEDFTGTAGLTKEEQGLGLSAAADTVKDLSKQAKKDIRKAYEVAKEKDASVSADLVQEYGQKIKAQLIDEGFDIEEMPKLLKSFEDIEGLTDDIPTSLNKLELLRKRINNRIEGKGSPEDTALNKLKKGYDEFLDELVDQSLINGDEDAINAFKQARSLVVDYQKKFNSDRVIKKIVKEDLEPEELVSMVFNGSQAGFKTNSGRIVKSLKKILGEDSDAFKQIKEEAFIRLISNQGDTFSGAKFDTALSKALERNSTVMRNVFTNKEIALLRRFGRVVKAATVRKDGVVNFSNSANKFFQRASKNLPIIEPIFEYISGVNAGSKATKTFGGNKASNDIMNLIRNNREGFKEAVAAGMVVKDVNQKSDNTQDQNQ